MLMLVRNTFPSDLHRTCPGNKTPGSLLEPGAYRGPCLSTHPIHRLRLGDNLADLFTAKMACNKSTVSVDLLLHLLLGTQSEMRNTS